MATELDINRSALVLVDLQRDLLHEDGALARIGLPALDRGAVAEIVATCQELVATMRRAGRPIVWVNTALRSDHVDSAHAAAWLEQRQTAGPFLAEGSWGAELMDGLAAEPGDYVVLKKGHAAFSETHLDRLLPNLGVNQYVLAGGGADDSIGETIRVGGRLGYEQYVVEDALYPPRAIDPDRLRNQVAVVTVEDIASTASSPAGEEPGGADYAMVLVDMQNDFMKPTQPNRSTIIENTQDVAAAVRARGRPVVYVYVLRREDNLDDAHSPQQTRQRVVARGLRPGVTHCAIGSWGAQIVDELQPQAGDFMVDKQGGSGFGFTPLHRILRNLNVHRLLMTGGSAAGCVRATALDGVALGYDVTVIGDATYGGGPAALDFLRQWCSVRQTADVVPELTGGGTRR